MSINTITFETTTAQNAKIKEAMDWRADREDPDNAPHNQNAAAIAVRVRKIALQYIKSEVRSDLADKRRAGATDEDVDDIS